MSDDRAPVRSYQRIFRPERRIYQVEGHRLPVPGGVPLRWLGYAMGSLIVVIALSACSWAIAGVLAAAIGVVGLTVGGRSAALLSAALALGLAQAGGFLLAAIDWPLRLLILPALVATVATQATPDGRAAHRYALSWLALQLRPPRRSLGRALSARGELRRHAANLAVAPDWHGPTLRRGRVNGPAIVRFGWPLSVGDGRGPLGRRLWACAHSGRARLLCRNERSVERVELVTGERLELRP